MSEIDWRGVAEGYRAVANEALDHVEALAEHGMTPHGDGLDGEGVSTFAAAAEFLSLHRPERWRLTSRGMRRIDRGDASMTLKPNLAAATSPRSTEMTEPTAAEVHALRAVVRAMHERMIQLVTRPNFADTTGFEWWSNDDPRSVAYRTALLEGAEVEG